MEGIILVNKSKGITSFDVVKKIRYFLKERRVGHTGTLDPLAEGLLIVCVGRATKLVSDLEGEDKIYEVEFELGYGTDTYDTEGKKICESNLICSEESIKNSLKKFIGHQKQIPPMYSAIKVDGEKMYNLARKGIKIELEPRDVRIDYIDVLDINENKVRAEVKVSKGTYIRSLVNDIGIDLKTYATMTALKRLKIADYDIKNSYSLDEIERLSINKDYSFMNSVEAIFNFSNSIELKDERAIKLFKNGNTVKMDTDMEDGKCRVYIEDEFIGLGTIKNNLLKGYKYF